MENNWDVPEVNPQEVNYFAGFLSSKPDQWFPAFNTHWNNFFKKFSINCEIQSTIPFIGNDAVSNYGWVSHYGNEKIAFVLDSKEAFAASALFQPSITSQYSKVFQEYLVRRFMKSLSLSWAASGEQDLKFDGEGKVFLEDYSAGVRVKAMLNSVPIEFDILVQVNFLNHLDGIWRRQTASLVGDSKIGELDLEFTSLNIPVNDVSKYIQGGVEYKIKEVNDHNILLVNGADIVTSAQILNSDGRFAIKILGSENKKRREIDGVWLSIVIGKFEPTTADIPGLNTPGALIPTGIQASGNVIIKVANEEVAKGQIEKRDNSYYVKVQ